MMVPIIQGLKCSGMIIGISKLMPNKNDIAAEMIPESLVKKPIKEVIDNPTQPELISGYLVINFLIARDGYR